jgi:hypothetical protein
MDTKNLLVFLAGAAVAYFVIREMGKQKAVQCPASIDCMPTISEGGDTRHPYCSNMPTECVGITRTTQ